MAVAEIRPDWTIGTLNLTSGSINFTTTGSMLQTAAIQPGDEIITRSGLVLIIASITGQNSGTLMEPCPAGAAGSGQPLRIRFQPDGSRYNGAAADLVQLLSSGVLYGLADTASSANSLPYFSGVGTWNTTTLTAAARALLNLAGSASANQLPYFTGEDGAGLTPLTAFARSILDDASGAAMWETMGGDQSRTANGFMRLPNGFIIQWGAFWSGTAETVPFPIAFPSACRAIVATKGQASMTPDNIYDNVQIGTYTTTGFEIAGRRVTSSNVVKANVTSTWIAIGH